MNRLQIAQRLRQESGIAGTGPTTTLNQTGEMKRVVDWVDGAWSELQSAHRWDFLWEQATVTILSGQYKVADTIPAHRYVKEGAYFGTTELVYLPWAEFRHVYPLALIQTSPPSVWTVRPDKSVAVNGLVTANSTLSLERYKNPVAMTADADVPALPVDHHMAIVWKALIMYANFEEAGVTRATAEAKLKEHLNALGVLELPEMDWGGALC